MNNIDKASEISKHPVTYGVIKQETQIRLQRYNAAMLMAEWKDKQFEDTPEPKIEKTNTDAFIEKALKWYCLDCACNDNCAANHKCAFWSFFKDYLEGNDKALPPKISNAFNPDGSTTENYRYRHIIERMKDDFIEKAARYLNYKLYDRVEVVTFGTTLESIILKEEFIDDFKNYMKGE